MYTPTQKEAIRFFMRRYLERAEANKANIHYFQFRPMNHLGKSPESTFTADCSGYVPAAFRWADLHLSYLVSDPHGNRYNGIGNTATLLSNNYRRRVPLDHKFFVGDMALYGPSLSDTKHVAICRKDGHVNDAIWSSHGSERGPYPVYLQYRPDLLCVVRAADLV